MCEKPLAIGFLRRATWLLHISLKGHLPFPEWMQDSASKRRGNPLLSFPHSSSSWAFNLISLHFKTWVLSLPHFPISPTAEHIPFPNISNLWSLIFPSAVSERSIKCSNLEILLMKTNENKVVVKWLLEHLCLSIAFTFSLLWGLDLECRLGFSDRWQRIIFHLVIKLPGEGLEKKDLSLGKVVASYFLAFDEVEKASLFWFSR